MGLALNGCMPLAIVLLSVLNQTVHACMHAFMADRMASRGQVCSLCRGRAAIGLAGPGRLDYVRLCLQGRF